MSKKNNIYRQFNYDATMASKVRTLSKHIQILYLKIKGIVIFDNSLFQNIKDAINVVTLEPISDTHADTCIPLSLGNLRTRGT